MGWYWVNFVPFLLPSTHFACWSICHTFLSMFLIVPHSSQTETQQSNSFYKQVQDGAVFVFVARLLVALEEQKRSRRGWSFQLETKERSAPFSWLFWPLSASSTFSTKKQFDCQVAAFKVFADDPLPWQQTAQAKATLLDQEGPAEGNELLAKRTSHNFELLDASKKWSTNST